MKKGQVWVETVIYTLIALVLIGAVLAFVNPKVKEIQDKAVIEQSISMMQSLDAVITSIVQGGAGNKRVIDLGIKKGTFTINGANDTVIFELQSNYEFSQTGETINVGGIQVLTKRLQNINQITLTKNYSNYDLTYNGLNNSKLLTQATTPYRLVVENKGGKPVLDFVVS